MSDCLHDRVPEPETMTRLPAAAHRELSTPSTGRRVSWGRVGAEALEGAAVVLFLIYALALLMLSTMMAGVVFLASGVRRLARAAMLTPPASPPRRRA